MSATKIIMIIVITIVVIKIVTQIFDFYGIGQDIYGFYLAFFIFLLITSFILPRKYHVI